MPPTEIQTASLRIEVNGEPRAVEAPCTLADLLVALELSGKRVAVALNRDVVMRSRYSQTSLTEGDRIEILEAVGGG
jgi:sulfur carrier protein